MTSVYGLLINISDFFVLLKNDEEFKAHLGIPNVSKHSSKKRILYSNYPRSKYEVDFVATSAETSAAPPAVGNH